MTKINPLGANQTELEFNNQDGVLVRLLFSYKTPVACKIGRNYYKTNYKWSATTSRHIANYFGRTGDLEKAIPMTQSFFDDLIK